MKKKQVQQRQRQRPQLSAGVEVVGLVLAAVAAVVMVVFAWVLVSVACLPELIQRMLVLLLLALANELVQVQKQAETSSQVVRRQQLRWPAAVLRDLLQYWTRSFSWTLT